MGTTNAIRPVAAASASQGFQLGAAPRQAGKWNRKNKKFLRRLQGGGPSYCDDSKKPKFAEKANPETGRCLNFSKGGQCGTTYNYPEDFKTSSNEAVLNEVTHYECASEGKRIIISNGIPDHSIHQNNPHEPC